jgi:hypothetical protein
MVKEILRKVLSQGCEKALDGSCHYATAPCFTPLPYAPDMRLIPARRWIECWGWKTTLNMFYDEKSGGYVYLSKNTRQTLDKLKLVPEESYDSVVKRLIEKLKRQQRLPSR